MPTSYAKIGAMFALEDLPERFRDKITKSDSGCWVWRTGNAYGYAGVKVDGRQRMAHRTVYEMLVGPIPAGKHIDHLCRVRACVNPEHLEPVSPRENVLRSPVAPAAINARATSCRNGHPFNEKNTYITPDGRRNCRPCRTEAKRRFDIRNGKRAV